MLGALTGVICSRSGRDQHRASRASCCSARSPRRSWPAVTGSLWLGLLCGALAGSLVGALLAVFAIGYRVDQVVLGVVLNTLILGPDRVPVRRR